MAQIGGKISIRVANKLLTVGDGDVTCNASSIKREAVLASDGPAGFTSKPQAPSIEGDLIHTRDLNVQELMAVEDATVMAELANGQTFILLNAWWAGDGGVDSQGKIKFKFEGIKGEFVRG